MLVKVKIKSNGQCRKGSRHVKGRRGCWRRTGSGMGSKKRR